MRDLSNWNGCEPVDSGPLSGRLVRLLPFDAEQHGAALWAAFGKRQTNALLRYFPWPVFDNADMLTEQIVAVNRDGGWQTCVFARADNDRVVGMASYMRTDAKNGSIEIGAVAHGPEMARSAMATEVHYLMARRVFDTYGYRRYEWKCDNDNETSKRTAVRLGFTFEGVFRQHVVNKGKNRDTAWFSMIDSEWPAIRTAFETWLAPSNFDATGMQIKRLEEIRGR